MLHRWHVVLLGALTLSGCDSDMAQPAQAAARIAADHDRAAPPALPNRADARSEALYARAQAYMRCAAMAETPQALGVADDGAGDASVSALDASAQRNRLAQGRACRQLGAGNDAQVDRLLRQAATAGSADARLELLRRRAGAVLERQPALATDGKPSPLSGSDHAEIEQVLAELEAMAMQGNRVAMPVLDQLLSSPLLDTAEPLYADAWRLVSQQPFGRPLPSSSLPGEEMFEDMDPATEGQVVLLARDLHAQCCASPGLAGASGALARNRSE